MTEETTLSWGLDPNTRILLRLERTREALRQRRFEDAIVEAEELLDDEPSHGEALWMLAEASMEIRDFLTALAAYRQLVSLGEQRPAILAGLAASAFECVELEDAERYARQAIEACPDLPEPHHIVGLCLERLQSPADARPHFAMAHRLRPLAFPYPLELSHSDWQLILGSAFEALPEHLQAFWRDVPVQLEAFPSLVDLQEPVPPISPRVAALYQGKVPDPADPSARPTMLRIYRGNLAHAESPDALMAQLLHALEHEALDWLQPDPIPTNRPR